MATSFRYALVEISGKPVLVDRRAIAEATTALREAINRIEEVKEEIKKSGFAMQTPEGMRPVVLGNLAGFVTWATDQMGIDFSLGDEIKKLPEPFKSGLSGIVDTDLVLYSAAFVYLPDAP